jgi:hypothetical protein
MGNPQKRQERREARRDYKMEAKNIKADHRNSIRDVNRAIKGERLEDRLAKKQQKLEHRADMERLKSGYSGTFHSKVNRLADKVKHGQNELNQIKAMNQDYKAHKTNVQGYDSKAHKKSLKMKHKEYMQEQKGKHRRLKRKTDINVNAPRTTDVDVNSDVDVWRPPMARRETIGPKPQTPKNGGWLNEIFEMLR